jgi:hypothetical protein
VATVAAWTGYRQQGNNIEGQTILQTKNLKSSKQESKGYLQTQLATGFQNDGGS